MYNLTHPSFSKENMCYKCRIKANWQNCFQYCFRHFFYYIGSAAHFYSMYIFPSTYILQYVKIFLPRLQSSAPSSAATCPSSVFDIKSAIGVFYQSLFVRWQVLPCTIGTVFIDFSHLLNWRLTTKPFIMCSFLLTGWSLTCVVMDNKHISHITDLQLPLNNMTFLYWPSFTRKLPRDWQYRQSQSMGAKHCQQRGTARFWYLSERKCKVLVYIREELQGSVIYQRGTARFWYLSERKCKVLVTIREELQGSGIYQRGTARFLSLSV